MGPWHTWKPREFQHSLWSSTKPPTAAWRPFRLGLHWVTEVTDQMSIKFQPLGYLRGHLVAFSTFFFIEAARLRLRLRTFIVGLKQIILACHRELQREKLTSSASASASASSERKFWRQRKRRKKFEMKKKFRRRFESKKKIGEERLKTLFPMLKSFIINSELARVLRSLTCRADPINKIRRKTLLYAGIQPITSVMWPFLSFVIGHILA